MYGVAFRTVECVIRGNVTCSVERGDRGVRGALLCCLVRAAEREVSLGVNRFLTFYESGLAELQLIDLAQITFLFIFMNEKKMCEFKLKRE